MKCSIYVYRSEFVEATNPLLDNGRKPLFSRDSILDYKYRNVVRCEILVKECFFSSRKTTMNLRNNCSEFGIFMTRASLPIFAIVYSGDLLILTLSGPCGTIHDTLQFMK